jgi:putative ABC transport system substrate-binding protein
MRRRELVSLLGGATAAWSFAARAQQKAMPVIGFLRSTSLGNATGLITAFRQGLDDAGFVEGQNVAVEYHSAENDPGQLAALVSDLIRRPVAVLVGNVAKAVAAKSATTSIPIVFAIGSDPVAAGLVASLNRPGGNVTGVSFLAAQLGSKRLELLHQLVPSAARIAVIVNPDNADTETERRDLQAAAQALRQQLVIFDVGRERDFETAFAMFVERGAGALYAGSGAFLNSQRERVVALAARHRLPAIYALREFVAAGGPMSYAPSITEAHRQIGVYAGRILKGEKPANLPVMQSTKFEFLINLKTAKALGLDVPPTLLIRTDEVIE